MASAAERDDPFDQPENSDRATAEQTSPSGPELGHRPYVGLMAAVGGIGIVAAAVATVLGLSTLPAMPFPVDVPTMPDLPSGFPSGLPGTPPTGFPTSGPEMPLPTDIPTSVPSLPTDFPRLPELPRLGGAS